MSFDINEIIEFNPTRKLEKNAVAPFISMAAIQENNKFVKEVELKTFSGGAKFKNGDTLFARITPCLENGKTAMVTILEESQIGHGSTEFIVLSPINESDAEYVYYLSRLPEFRQYAKSRMEGTSGRQRVSWQSLSEFNYPFPAKEVRARIGKILSLFDSKIELNNQINETLETMAQALFKSWFIDFEPVKAKIEAKEAGQDAEGILLAAMSAISGKEIEALKVLQTTAPEEYAELKGIAEQFPDSLEESELGMIPKGWEVRSFFNWIEPKRGKSITKKKVIPGNIPVVAGGLEPAYYHNEHNVIGPAITISASGANAGFINLYFENIWSSDSSYISSKETECIFTAYILLKLRQTDIFKMQTGAAQPHIYPKDFERLFFTYPGMSLFSQFEKYICSSFQKIGKNIQQNKTLTELRDTLLPKLLSGEIDVSNVEIDELLENET